MPKTGSPLAKGELHTHTYVCVIYIYIYTA
jgi:hypothetical protein